MKTKQLMMDGSDVELGILLDPSNQSNPLGGALSVKEEEEDPSVLVDAVMQDQDQEIMSTPSEYLSASENGSDQELDSDSEWEDIDSDEDDDCILFMEECPSSPQITTKCQMIFKDCIPKTALDGMEASSISSSSSNNKINGKVGLKISGLVIGYHFKPCWISTKFSLDGNKSNTTKPACSGKDKKVRFNDDNLTKVIEFEDDEDSKQMRKLYWEIFAIDRARFRDRISRTEETIGHIFKPEHRDRIYNEIILPRLDQKNKNINNAQKVNHPNSSLDTTNNEVPQQNVQQNQSRGRCKRRNRKRRNKKAKSLSTSN